MILGTGTDRGAFLASRPPVPPRPIEMDRHESEASAPDPGAQGDFDEQTVLGTSTAAPADPAARLETLARFLDDESPQVLTEVRRQLRGAGKSARPTLSRAARSASPATRVRARALLAELDRAPTVRRVLGYLLRDDVELENGLLLMGRLADPDLDARVPRALLDEFALEVQKKSRRRSDPLQRALALVEILGRGHGFAGARRQFHRPDHVHLHRVLEKRRGIPLTLCAIYAAVARRSGLKVGLLPLPGHVLLRLHGATTSLIVDPYHRGEIRSEKDLRRQLRARGLGFKAAWFRDADAHSILRRQIANLARSAQEYGRADEHKSLCAIVDAVSTARAARAAAN